MLVILHPAARDEAREAYMWLAREDGQLAVDFESRFRAALSAIAENPEACQLGRYGVRRRFLHRFRRHYLAYMILDGRIVVLALGHASRPPYYWYRRPKSFRNAER